MNNYRIVGRLYGNDPQYLDWDKEHKYPFYKEIDEAEWNIEAESLTSSQEWLMEHHPEYYMGCSIDNTDPNKTEFYLGAVPSVEYPKGCFETIKARREYVTNIFKTRRWQI